MIYNTFLFLKDVQTSYRLVSSMLLNSEPERIIIADLMTIWITISESDNYHFQLVWLNQSTWWKINKNSIIFLGVIGSGLLYFRFSQCALFYFRNGCSATITSRVAKRHCQIIRELPSDNFCLQRRKRVNREFAGCRVHIPRAAIGKASHFYWKTRNKQKWNHLSNSK